MIDQLAPLPDDVRKVVDDPARRDVLAALQVMDSEPDPDFDRLTRIAARLFGTEFAQVTLVDAGRQWFRSCFGIDGLTETDTEVSFCAHTIAAVDRDHLMVLDMTQDERFSSNPFVTGWRPALPMGWTIMRKHASGPMGAGSPCAAGSISAMPRASR